MIIRHLHIDNFGCFHNFDLDLEPGFNRFVWQNESGKSTLLEFIRRIFWGFPDKRSKLNPFPALKGSGLYGGFLDVTLNDGTPLRLERRGERGKLKIISQDGSAEQVSDISSYAGVSEIFYRNVCAVTLDELTAFAALDDPEIRNRLYGNALSGGTVSLSELQEQLSAESEKIFKKRGIHNQLRHLAAEFDASEKRLAEAANAMPAYEKAILSAEEIEKRSEILKEEIQKLEVQIAAAQKVRDAEMRRNQLEQDETAFGKRPAPAPVPEPVAPFTEKAPVPPAPPEYPQQLPVPQKPENTDLEGKCDLLRGSKVDDASRTDALNWLTEWRRCEKSKGSPLLWAGVSFGGLLLAIGGAICFRHLLPGTIIAAAGVCGLIVCLRQLLKTFAKAAELKKQKEDIFFRFSLNPALEPDELPELLARLAAYQSSLAEYEEAVKLCEERRKQIEALRQEYETQRKLYDLQCSAYLKSRESYDKQRLVYEEKCRRSAVELAQYETEKQTLVKRRKELEQIFSSLPDSKVEVSQIGPMKEELAGLEKQLEENMKLSGAERREAALLLKGRDSSVELNIREQLRGKMRSAAERFLILSAARIILERAVERSERERQPELLRKGSLFLAQLTDNAYTRVYKSVSDNSLKISSPECPEGKNVSQLSRGTREQLFLALRLALIDSFDETTESLPAVFDDILVNFDNRRRPSALQTLETFAHKRQILVFECQ